VINDRDRLALAFADLFELGYFAPVDFSETQCCQSCAWYAVPDGVEKVVFWHQQDDERAFGGTWEVNEWEEEEYVRGGDNLVKDLYLAWAGDASEIVAALRKYDLLVEEPPDESQRILVKA
jgi:hypothetical protein